MKLHLIGGFLGAGKTTTIIQASRLLMQQGLRVGVITNDQGKYLVDTAFFRLADLPAVEVTGGCFCCNYDTLDSRLAELMQTARPDVIFAESVGSCADIVATVVKPLIELGQKTLQPTSFSVLADARLLLRRLQGKDMPFSDDVVYIFDKQMEEAGILVVNKTDLLGKTAVEEVRILLKDRFPAKPIIFQSSLDPTGVQSWLELAQSGYTGLPLTSLSIDYARYGQGEAQLAWLDEEVMLHVPLGQAQHALREILVNLLAQLEERKAGIGHLKLIVQNEETSGKVSFTTPLAPDWEAQIPAIDGTEISLLVNARVEMGANQLASLFERVLAESGFVYSRQNTAAFHPGMPRPTHRLA